MFVERRAFPRTTVRRPAEIVIVTSGLRTSSYTCTVVNCSEGGALLEVGKLTVPDEFQLNFQGASLAARVVGRTGDQVRVQFER